ncbi:cysteine desulfurase family protein [Metabacillus fastidiosus]|uniref:cysteine desulfurase family protein n=1 Tax=Metabacillus fastidiosus TaxID=1458 RepID=UPI003D29B758
MLYLDNSATTMPFKEVISTYGVVAEKYFANPSSLHRLGGEAEHLLNEARRQVSELLQTEQNEIIFTSGGTESNNLAIKGAAFANKHRGNHLITSEIEHPSVLEAFKQLEQFHGFTVTYIPVNEEGAVSVEKIEKEIRPDTILVSIMHVNNEVGTIQPIEEIGEIIKKYPQILFHVDHVQGITKVPLEFKKANIDLCSISGHKFHGLNGTGVLFVKKGVKLIPLLSGGQQEMMFRSGTESLAGNVSLAKALRLATELGAKHRARLKDVQLKLIKELQKIPEVVINTNEHHSAPHIVNFSVPGIKSEVLVHYFEEQNIFVSTTSACSSKRKNVSQVLLAMNKDEQIANSSIRVSFSFEQDEQFIFHFITVLKDGILKLMKVMRS